MLPRYGGINGCWMTAGGGGERPGRTSRVSGSVRSRPTGMAGTVRVPDFFGSRTRIRPRVVDFRPLTMEVLCCCERPRILKSSVRTERSGDASLSPIISNLSLTGSSSVVVEWDNFALTSACMGRPHRSKFRADLGVYGQAPQE
jgi:hypothetical protein